MFCVPTSVNDRFDVFGAHLPAGLDAERCRVELARRRVHVSVRGDAVRVSPHVYNDAADLARLADALIEVARATPPAR